VENNIWKDLGYRCANLSWVVLHRPCWDWLLHNPIHTSKAVCQSSLWPLPFTVCNCHHCQWEICITTVLPTILNSPCTLPAPSFLQSSVQYNHWTCPHTDGRLKAPDVINVCNIQPVLPQVQCCSASFGAIELAALAHKVFYRHYSWQKYSSPQLWSTHRCGQSERATLKLWCLTGCTETTL
jgi:hypothetical protein